jgi:hypothetical protein
MVESIGSRGGVTLTQQVGQTQDVQKTTGRKETQGISGVGTQELEVRPQSSAPQNDDPKVSQQTMEKSYDNIVQALSSSGLKDVDISAMVLEIQGILDKLNREQMKTQQTNIKGTQDQVQKNVNDQIEKLGEAQKKMEDQKTWDTFKDIFTYAAMAVSVLAAVATGGALSILVAGLGVALTIAQKTGAMDKMFDAMGASQEVRTAITIGLSVALIAGSITNVAMIAKGVGQAWTTALLPKMMEMIGVLGKGAQAVGNVAGGVQMVAGVVTGVLKVGEGVNQIGSSVAGFEKAEIDKQVKDMQTSNMKLKDQQQELIEQLKALLELLEDGVNMATQVLQSQSQTMQKMTQRLS